VQVVVLYFVRESQCSEGKGYGGFPVSGQWLKCTNPDVIAKHKVKVYGKASVGAPPMSVPHIDSRMINGENSCYLDLAGFLSLSKNGSYSDLPYL
jgi:malate dehydrogenase (quinone)